MTREEQEVVDRLQARVRQLEAHLRLALNVLEVIDAESQQPPSKTEQVALPQFLSARHWRAKNSNTYRSSDSLHREVLERAG